MPSGRPCGRTGSAESPPPLPASACQGRCFQVPLNQQKRLDLWNVCDKSGRRTSAGTQVGMGIGTGMKQVDKRDVLHNMSTVPAKANLESAYAGVPWLLSDILEGMQVSMWHTNESEAGQADCAAVRRCSRAGCALAEGEVDPRRAR